MRLTLLLKAWKRAEYDAAEGDSYHHWRQCDHFYAMLMKRLVVADGRCRDCRAWQWLWQEDEQGWGSCWLTKYGDVTMRYRLLQTRADHGCRAWQPKEDA